ncbi:hypothetical protein [Halosegnis longus]|uniref:Uncharacterized protein n=1 Tax=Halosegnis longus TaxID=2216012 RepID=A0AAJ4R7F2_9EURY|nr:MULTISPECIES: hypothetical protein [Halobacteriales]RNJ25669.1 hypothetical protein Nmn1133_02520 [Salella cibi]
MSRSGETLLEREQESEPESTTEESPGRLARVKRRVTPSMTGRSLLLAVVVTVAASALVGTVPLVPGSVATLVGLGLAGFLLGLVRSAASYLEMAIAGGAAAALSLVSNLLLFSAAGNAGLAVAGGGVVAGIISGVVGHYFGRDLRDGLTRSL